MRSYWEKLCLCLVNDTFDAELRPFIQGIWLTQRIKYDKVSIWTSNYEENLDEQHRIGRQMREILLLRRMIVLVFEPHEASILFKREAENEAAKKKIEKNGKEKSSSKKFS